MPLFRLEGIKYDPKAQRVHKMLYCKKEYNPKVKLEDWYMHLEHRPIDTNPYNPKCFRLHNSHYDRLGTHDHMAEAVSETRDSLKQGTSKTAEYDQDPHKAESCEQKIADPCSVNCPQFNTTMKDSYTSPYPNVINGLQMPTTGNQNKRMAPSAYCKFLDDKFVNFTNTLQMVKGFRHTSFNPLTGLSIERTF